MTNQNEIVKLNNFKSWEKLKDLNRFHRIDYALRKEQITGATLAKKLGISRQYVTQIKWGINKPRKIEKKIARILGYRWNELFK